MSYGQKLRLILAFVLFQFCTPIGGHGFAPLGLLGSVGWVFLGSHDAPYIGIWPWIVWAIFLTDTIGGVALLFAVNSSQAIGAVVGKVIVLLLAAVAIAALFTIGEISFLSVCSYIPFTLAAVWYLTDVAQPTNAEPHIEEHPETRD